MVVGNTADAILVLAPTGQDAALAVAVLADAGVAAQTATDMPDVCTALQRHTFGALMLAEEGLQRAGVLPLLEGLSTQPPWSDIPIIVLALPTEPTYQSAQTLKTLTTHANVTLLERPFRPATLIATVQSALRARRRQYQVRDLLSDQTRALQQKDDFISVASHELKTPLTSIGLQTYINKQRLAQGEDPSGEWVSKLVETTDRQITRLIRLVDDMLDISRINAGQIRIDKQTTDLVPLLRAEIERLAPQLAAAECVVEFHEQGAVIGEWDPYRLEQIVGNLLTNAIRYAPGRPITVRVGCDVDTAVLSVQDRGEGIAPADQERIFARFERAANAVAGLGLGLYICRELVSLHGGTIGVDSAPGQGATFVVRLPLRS